MGKVKKHRLPSLNDSWPFYYSYDRGHYWMEERDLYGDQLDHSKVISDITVDVFKESDRSPSGYWVLREPMSRWFGKTIGPNYAAMVARVKKIFDPADMQVPDRLIFMRPPERAAAKGGRK
jgi:hypothetical protein